MYTLARERERTHSFVTEGFVAVMLGTWSNVCLNLGCAFDVISDKSFNMPLENVFRRVFRKEFTTCAQHTCASWCLWPLAQRPVSPETVPRTVVCILVIMAC